MNRWLVVALVVSVAGNLLLLAGRRPAGPSGPPRGPEAGPAVPAHPAEDLARRVAALEEELAAARARAAAVEEGDPVHRILALRVPAGEKARLLAAIEPEEARRNAAWKVGREMGALPEAGAELLAALREERDPKVLAVLVELLRAGAAHLAPAEFRIGFAGLLRMAEDPLARVAAAYGCQGGGPVEDEVVAAALLDALRSDPAPEVAAAAAQKVGRLPLPPGGLDALRAAADRLPAGEPRRAVFVAIAQSALPSDETGGKEELFTRFEAASDQGTKDDLAWALAVTANASSGAMRPGATPTAVEEHARRTRDRLFALYRAASELRTRQYLARAAQFGFAEAYRGIGLAGLYRELADLEPDPAQRERLLRASELPHGKIGSDAVDRVLYGRE